MNSVHRAAGVGFRIMMWVEARPGAAGFGFLGSFMGPVSEQQVAECFWGMIGKGRKEQRRHVWECAQGFCLWTCRCPRQMAEGGAPRTLWSKAYSLAGQKYHMFAGTKGHRKLAEDQPLFLHQEMGPMVTTLYMMTTGLRFSSPGPGLANRNTVTLK